MRLRNNNKARVVSVPYAATVNFTPGSGDVTLKVGQMTGALAINIIDAFAEDGDVLKLLYSADATQRIITIGGAQGAGGTITVGANGAGASLLIYNSDSGNYLSTVTPV